MKRVILIFTLLAIVSCKTESKEQAEVANAEPEEISKELIISMSFKTNKADNFRFSLMNIKVDEFQKKNIQILESVEPTSEFDNLTANFGPNNISNSLKIGFGTKEEKTVSLGSLNISYGENSLDIPPNALSDYFTTNKFIEIDSVSNTLTVKRVDGRMNPLMSLKPKYFKSLNPR